MQITGESAPLWGVWGELLRLPLNLTDLEGIMLSEVSDTKREMPDDPTCVWDLKKETNNKNKLIGREQTGGCQRQEKGEDGGWAK